MTFETEDFEFNGNLYLDIKEGSHDWYLAWGPLYLASHPAYSSLIDEYMLMDVYITDDGEMYSLFKAHDERDKPKYLTLGTEETYNESWSSQ